MPIIPDSFVPSVSESVPQPARYNAPGVNPMRNGAPEQMQQMGAATEAMGNQMLEMQQIRNVIQGRIDNAKVKDAETQFIGAANDLMRGEDGYLTKQNADAMNDYQAVQENLVKAKQQAADGLDNDVQKTIFNRVAQAHLAAFGNQISQHMVVQRRNYEVSQSQGRADSMRVMAQNVDVGSADQDSLLQTGLSEVRNVMASKGFAQDSDETANAEREYRTKLTEDNINRLMINGDYSGAKSLLEAQIKAGFVTADSADKLRTSVYSNAHRVEVQQTADAIFASKKGITGEDLESALAEANKISDETTRKDVQQELRSYFSHAVSLRDEEYRDNLKVAENYKAAHGGSVHGIDPSVWGKLDAKDRVTLLKPTPIENNADTVANFIINPDTITTTAVQSAWAHGKLSKETYFSLLRQASNQEKSYEKVRSVSIDEDQLRATLIKNNMPQLVNPSSFTRDKVQRANLNNQAILLRKHVRDVIDNEQRMTGKTLTRERKQQIMDQSIMDQIHIGKPGATGNGGGNQFTWLVNPHQLGNAYVTIGNGQRVNPSYIPAPIMQRITTELQQAGAPPTAFNIATRWDQLGRPIK